MPNPSRCIDALVLDRDGTVIEDRHYLHQPEGVALISGAAEALAEVAAQGVRLFVVTNQSGLGRGYFGLEAYQATEARLREVLLEQGVPLADCVYCPHAPDEGCDCRKPAQGLWNTLAARHKLVPGHTAVIGDKLCDVEFGQGFGAAATALVLTGHGSNHAGRAGISLPPQQDYAFFDHDAPGKPDILAVDLPQALAALRKLARFGRCAELGD